MAAGRRRAPSPPVAAPVHQSSCPRSSSPPVRPRRLAPPPPDWRSGYHPAPRPAPCSRLASACRSPSAPETCGSPGTRLAAAGVRLAPAGQGRGRRLHESGLLRLARDAAGTSPGRPQDMIGRSAPLALTHWPAGQSVPAPPPYWPAWLRWSWFQPCRGPRRHSQVRLTPDVEVPKTHPGPAAAFSSHPSRRGRGKQDSCGTAVLPRSVLFFLQ